MLNREPPIPMLNREPPILMFNQEPPTLMLLQGQIIPMFLRQPMIHSPSHVRPIDRMNETPDCCKQTVIFTEATLLALPFCSSSLFGETVLKLKGRKQGDI